MQNLWNDAEAAAFGGDPVKLRVYTSRLLGREPALVVHGGGNTSVKVEEKNLFGETESLCYVKGSGWDLVSIEAAGFAPVKMDVLMKMAALERLSDPDMVRVQRAAMTNPNAPAPSVEAILHALIPYRFVDHTHADAVVAISNTPAGLKTIEGIFGDKILVVPYVMPGFILARQIFELTRKVDWSRYEGMILMHHGVFSFADDAKTSYDRMIRIVSKAEDYLKAQKAFDVPVRAGQPKPAPKLVARLRKSVSRELGAPVVAKWNSSPEAVSYSKLENIASVSQRGPLTPDHVIHTKRTPLLIGSDQVEDEVTRFAGEYKKYFARNKTGDLTCLDSAPRWAVWPGHGTYSFGTSAKKADVVGDVTRHTMRAIQWAEALGGWKALPEKDIFDVEYWDLEQAKLKKGAAGQVAGGFQGKVALVTGAASGIGKACMNMLREQGAAVVALDLNPEVETLFKGADALGIVCDVTNPDAVRAAVEKAVLHFGGLDILVTNAGSFPKGQNISELDADTWRKTIEINLSSHEYLLHAAIPYLELGCESAIVVIGSKNVPAPGPGAAAYSAAKAGLTQLARVAALELGPKGIRVNIIHPNAVFDTAIWTPEVLANRAKHYGMSVEDYKTNNVLRTEVTSKDVARLACAMAGPVFGKTTGSQVPIDGGNDRVI